MTITLTHEEFFHASQVGMSRNLANRLHGRKDAHGLVSLGWSEHIEGACGEMALAKALGVYYSPALGHINAPDLNGTCPVEVRTRSKHAYELTLYPSDKDNALYVLLTGRAPTFRVRGWIRGRDGKRDEWYGEKAKKGRPAYFVPHGALRDMDELLNLLSARKKHV